MRSGTAVSLRGLTNDDVLDVVPAETYPAWQLQVFNRENFNAFGLFSQIDSDEFQIAPSDAITGARQAIRVDTPVSGTTNIFWVDPNTGEIGGTPCASAASPAVCGASWSGSVALAAAGTTLVVDTTAVTANSTINLTEDSSLGTKLSVTCNTQSSLVLGTPVVTARTAATSFTISVALGPTTNPMCINWHFGKLNTGMSATQDPHQELADRLAGFRIIRSAR